MPDNARRTQPVRDLIEVVGWGVLAVVFLFLIVSDVREHRISTRGIESGIDMPAAPHGRRFGVNVALDQYESPDALRQALATASQMGFGTLRQRFPWAEIEMTPGEYQWETWDRVLDATAEQDMEVIAVLDTSPAWARPQWEQSNIWAPPTDSITYSRFVRAFAERYGDRVIAYQIWDQPNISPHWGVGAIDPAGYVALLQKASAAIRQADPNGRIIAGGLAPNLESGGRNMSDVQFLHEIYRRDAGDHFDILGVKAFGFWSGPEDRRVDDQLLNYSRIILLRQEMIRREEADKPIWAMDAGWCALEDWQGEASPHGSDSAFVQGERVTLGLQRMREEWPWMERVCLMHLQPDAPPNDPIWGYALLANDSKPTEIARVIRRAIRDQRILYPGSHRDWQATATPASDEGAIELAFWGDDLAVGADWGAQEGSILITIDDHHRKKMDLSLASGPGTWKSVGRFLSPQEHHALLTGTPEQMATIATLRVGHRPSIEQCLWSTLAGLMAGVGCGIRAWQAGRRVAWPQYYGAIRGLWERIPTGIQWGLLLVAWIAAAVAPWTLVRLASLVLYAACALLAPHYALSVAILSIPLAPLHVRLGPGSFSLAETSVLIATAARLGHTLLWPAQKREHKDIPSLLQHIDLLDILVLLLVTLGLSTSFLAEYRRVAFREWRVVVCESALMYGLVRIWVQDRRALVGTMDLVLMGGLGVALFALIVYPSPVGVIEAEGVRRARAFYGSPNNLALYLERILPLAIAVGLFGRTRWRRQLYRWGAIPIALALLLTFSRGALLVGLPAAALVLASLRGGRTSRWLLIGLAVCIAVMIPFSGTERFASLFDFRQGTSFLRISLWRASIEMVRDHPWLGIGLDNFLYYYGDYVRVGAEVDRWLSHPHNILLDFWLRLGLAGVVLIAGIMVSFWRRALRTWQRADDTDSRAMLLGAMAGMAAMLAHGSIDSSFFVIELAHWFMFTLAWVSVAWTGIVRTRAAVS